MSTETPVGDEQRHDVIVEDDVRRGWAVVEVPTPLQNEVKEAGITPFTHIRLTRLNPTRRRKITEVVQRAYFRDLKDSELLSTSQVKELVESRGEWTAKHEERLVLLHERTTSKMMTLYHEGVRRSQEWLDDLGKLRTRFVDIVDSSELGEDIKLGLKTRFERWFTYTPRQQTEYQQRFPEFLSPDGLYYPDKDLSWILDNSPTWKQPTSLRTSIT
jgi:hypothetical protein